MTIILGILFTLYFLSMIWLIVGFARLKEIVLQATKAKHQTKFSIVVPFRNEAENLPSLLASLAAIEYPTSSFEVLLIDDESSDLSVRIIHSELLRLSTVLKTQLLIDCSVLVNKRVSGSPKKDAIKTAVQHAKFDWIVTTDADCIVPKYWLQCYDQLIANKKPKMVCGPVSYRSDKSFVEQYQLIDGLILQGVTIGSFGWNSPLLCNGANLAYAKSAFIEASGFEGNNHLASGDDIFMLEKIKQLFPKQISYLKLQEATVITQPEISWSQLIEQRIRWASKTSKQTMWGSKILGLIVFATNLAFILCLFGIFIWPLKVLFFAAFLGLKLMLDQLLLRLSSIFFRTPISMRSVLLSSLLYPFVTLWVVFNSFNGSYTWKNRTFKK